MDSSLLGLLLVFAASSGAIIYTSKKSFFRLFMLYAGLGVGLAVLTFLLAGNSAGSEAQTVGIGYLMGLLLAGAYEFFGLSGWVG